jgi:hypothetical protein
LFAKIENPLTIAVAKANIIPFSSLIFPLNQIGKSHLKTFHSAYNGPRCAEAFGFSLRTCVGQANEFASVRPLGSSLSA